MFEDLVKQKERELIENNFLDLRKNIDDKDYNEKIKNYCEKFHFDYNEVKNKILNDDIIASFFIKEPSRQNFTEKLAASLLKITTLPQQGKNSIRFTSTGEITSKKSTNVSKSADFYFNNTYYTQKYTRDNGGAQDNQYNDVVDFLIKGSIKNKVGAIVDGPYWDVHRNKLKNYFKDNPNVSIHSMDDFIME